MPDDELTSLVNVILRLRRNRHALFRREMFGGEQAWELLLILFVADARGERLSGRMAIDQQGGAVETGRRLLQYLTSRNLIVGDGEGHLDDTLTLTPAGLQKLELWLSEARAAFADCLLPVPRQP
jgi:hypothetical protein